MAKFYRINLRSTAILFQRQWRPGKQAHLAAWRATEFNVGLGHDCDLKNWGWWVKQLTLLLRGLWAGGGGLSWWIDCTRSREEFSWICEVEYSISEAQKNRASLTRVALLLFGTLMREYTISRGEDQHNRPEKDADTRSKEEEQQQRWRWEGFWWAPGTGWRWQGFPWRRQSWCVGPPFALLSVELQLVLNFLHYPSLQDIRDMDSNSSRIAGNPPTVPPARESILRCPSAKRWP